MESQVLKDEVIIALRRIIRAIDLHSKKLVQTCGLTGPQIITLKSIVKFEKIPAGKLAKEINLSAPTVKSILDRLEAKGFIFRIKAEHDKRVVYVVATESGHKKLENSPSLLQDDFIKKLSTLKNWEQTNILANLQRIADMMDINKIEAAPVLTSTEIS